MLGGLVNRFVPHWLFRFRSFVVYQIDPAKFPPIDAATVVDSDSQQPDTQVADGQAIDNSKLEVSWCQSDDDLRAVEALTYTRSRSIETPFKIAQAKSGDRLAGALWSVQDEFLERELGVRYDLAADQVWLFAALVNKQFRRQGVYLKVLRFMCCDGQTHQRDHRAAVESSMNVSGGDAIDGVATRFTGTHKLLCINPFNVASMKAHRKFIQRELGRAWVMRVFNKAICFHRGDFLQVDSMWTTNTMQNPITFTFKNL